MAVYVDNALIPARLGRWESRWSHMVADTEDELHEFALKIGLRPEWFQANAKIPHYDVTVTKRTEAIDKGAVSISSKELVRKFSKK